MTDIIELRDWHKRRAHEWGQYACEGSKEGAAHQAAHVETARLIDLLARVRESATIVAARYGQNEDVLRLEFDSSDVMRELAEALRRE